MKGIILAGGEGTRLGPLTGLITKHLMYVYDKPMIFYPISSLMLSGIKDILIITKKRDLKYYKTILGNGKRWGLKIKYAIQNKSEGIAQAFIIGEKFIGSDSVCLILGDNVFYGNILSETFSKCVKENKGCTVLCYSVDKPENFGVALFNKNKKISKVIEKPKKYIGNQAVVGMYFFDENVSNYAKKIKKSKRNEYEITDLINYYIKNKNIDHIKLGRGVTWFDAGTFDDLMKVSNFVKITEELQGLKIGCLDEIALLEGNISIKQFDKIIQNEKNPDNKSYLLKVRKDI